MARRDSTTRAIEETASKIAGPVNVMARLRGAPMRLSCL